MIYFLKKLDLKTILILVLIIVILLMRACTSTVNPKKGGTIKVNGKKYVVVKHDIDTVYKPVKQVVYRPGEVIFVDKPVYVKVPTNVDTAAILRDYYTKYPYKDTLKLTEGLGFITINDTIFKNKILNRTFVSHVNKITIKETLYSHESNAPIAVEMSTSCVPLYCTWNIPVEDARNFNGLVAMT